MTRPLEFPELLQSFFSQRLMAQRQASPHTIASYRDTFRLLLQFACKTLGKPASRITLEDLNVAFIATFLDSLEQHRGNAVRTRNLRMAVIRSFFRYAALESPQHAGLVQRVLAMPSKRHERRLVGFLSRPEIEALLAAPNRNTWRGRRDHALLLMAVQTGLRLSEITSLRQQDIVLGRGAHVRCMGKECHSYCVSLRSRHETTGTHACQPACDLAFSLADLLLAVRIGIGLGPYTGAHGASRVEPMCEPSPA